MTANNPNVDLVSINSYIKFGEIQSICSQDNERKQNYGVNHNSRTKVRKMMWNNLNLDLVNMNAYIIFCEILSICSQDTERKQNFGFNQGP